MLKNIKFIENEYLEWRLSDYEKDRAPSDVCRATRDLPKESEIESLQAASPKITVILIFYGFLDDILLLIFFVIKII